MRLARFAFGVLLRGLLVGLALAGLPGDGFAMERHAGTVLSVDAGQRMLTLDEFGANAVRGNREVRLSSNATVLLSERNEPVTDWNRVFTDKPIDLADLRAGDFIVVEMSQPGVADTVIVTLRREARTGS